MPREKALFGKEEIFRVAIRLVDSGGMDALSIRTIAKELGISPMTIYNYVDSLYEIKKRVLINGFDRLYAFIFSKLSELETPVDKIAFCKTVATAVFQFSADNKNLFVYMFSEGEALFSNDAEVRPFYSLISNLTQRAKATRKEYAANEKGYKLLEMLIFSVTYQFAVGAQTVAEEEYSALIDYYLDKCIR